MILDKQNLISEDQAITVSAAGTNVIDLGDDDALTNTPNEKGAFCEVLFQVTTAFAGGTSLKVDLCNEADASITDASGSVVGSAVIATATLVAGYQFAVRMPRTLALRYLGAFYTVVGTMSAGNLTAAIVLDVQTNNG